MIKLKINSISFPKYCASCHQADRYDPYYNYCGRCNNVQPIRSRYRKYTIRSVMPTLWQPINYGKDAAYSDSIIAICIMAILFGGLGTVSSWLFKFSFQYMNFGSSQNTFNFILSGFVVGSLVGAIYGGFHEYKLRKAWQQTLNSIEQADSNTKNVGNGEQYTNNVIPYRPRGNNSEKKD